jgi:hypothetical protein
VERKRNAKKVGGFLQEKPCILTAEPDGEKLRSKQIMR